MSNTFFQQQLTAAQAQLTALNEAQLAVVSGAVESYQLDTGQSVTRVTKANIGVMNRMIDVLMNRVATLEARCNGGQVLITRPGW